MPLTRREATFVRRVGHACADSRRRWHSLGATPDPSIELVVEGGTPLRVALDQRTIVKRVGQLVAATLVEPVSAYDRVVLPAGTKVIGHVESIQSAGKRARALGIMRGDFTPPRRVLLQFDRLIMNDGTELAVQTAAAQGAEYVVRRVAGDNGKKSTASRARRAIEEQAKEAASVVTAPHKKERFEDASIRALPYHPVFLPRGTTYSAKLLSTLSFGSATPAPRAAAGAIPAPDSVLRARLETSVASDTSPRGTPVTARVTQPVLSPDGSLVLPAGTLLTGQVTFSKGRKTFSAQRPAALPVRVGSDARRPRARSHGVASCGRIEPGRPGAR